ncbi:unnamed protein product [Adineta steineri]|uniref:Uncharacterized protein n=1 Tax=Adineta steineri TaxID=433720 RepID=A0A813XZ15_9BILA|nr:unnamed protein product [Adineta steineri]CAF0872156.1 unnamed protein product [Adineta steineri]
MITLVETLSTVELSTVTHHRTSSHNYNVNLDNNKQIVEQLSEPYKLINSIENNHTFDLHIPGEYLEKLLEDPPGKFEQIRIHVYYEKNGDLEHNQNCFQLKHNKIQFCLERDLEKQLQNTETSIATSSPRSIDRPAINGITTSIMERLFSKRSNPSHYDSLMPKKFHSTTQSDTWMKNMEEIDLRFSCAYCKLLLREPYQLTCGHRLCKSCVHIHNKCAICFEVIEKDKIWLDRGLEIEIRSFSKTCSQCEWRGPLTSFKEHIEYNHGDSIVCSCCKQQVDRSNLSQHYLSETHQRNLLSRIRSMVLTDNNSSRLNNQIVNGYSISTNDANVLKNYLEHTERDILLVQNNIERLKKQSSLFETVLQATINDIANETISRNSLTKNSQLSNDGSFIWRITNVKEKRMDAASERQMSIYSEPFYSSPTGYKMRLRLYLNGDGNARGTHLSLFLVIMRNEFDAIIHWPFKYKIIFTLLNQLQSDSPSKYFWPDVNLASFHRPTTDMNTACGIPKFFPLDIFKKTYAEYVQNDTMFVKVEVDFTSERSELVFIPGVNELANDEKHADTIHEDIYRMISLS